MLSTTELLGPLLLESNKMLLLPTPLQRISSPCNDRPSLGELQILDLLLRHLFNNSSTRVRVHSSTQPPNSIVLMPTLP